MPLDLLRHIRLLQILRVLIRQFNIHRLHRLVYPLFTPQTHDRIDTRLLDGPRYGNLSHTDTLLFRHLFQTIHDRLVDLRLFTSNERFEKVVSLFALGRSVAPRPRQHTTSNRTPLRNFEFSIALLGREMSRETYLGSKMLLKHVSWLKKR